MTINNDQIIQSTNQLQTLLLHGDIFKEIESHPLIYLCDQLQNIDENSHLISIEEKHKLNSILQYFEINCFYDLIKRYSSTIPSLILTTLFDFIRLQIYLNMQINPSMSDYYFNLSLTYLISDSTIDYLMNKNQVISSDIDEHFLKLFSSIGSRAVFTKTTSSYSSYVSDKIVPTFFQLNDSTERLLHAFIIYLNNHLQYQSSISILKWLLNMTDICGFIPYFVKIGYPNAILQWMSIKRNISSQNYFLILNLLHNLARYWMGVKALNKLKIIDILKQWKEEYFSTLSINDCDEEYNKDILIAYYLVYAILLEPKLLKTENISNIQTVLDYILDRTIQAFDSSDLRFGPYNVCEYLNGLAKLVVNDTYLHYILSHESIYNLFIEKFLLFNNIYELTTLNTIICSSLYTIFWSISFQLEYIDKLKSNERFVLLVEQISIIQSNDEHILIMKRAAKGILFNLDLIQINIEPIIEDHHISNDQIKVMISYAHKDTKFCRKLVKNLEEYFQGDIWVDFNKLSQPYEDDWEEIAKAITQCDVILMVVTENYCSSKSCRREVIHADKRNKRMIPIYQGKDYKPEDWFEIRIGSATWIRFEDKKTDEEVIETLVELINVQNKVKQNLNESNSKDEQTINTNSIPPNPIEQWTCEEVQQWLHLPSTVLQLSSGRALITYMNLLSHKDAQYDEYEQRMRIHGISREQFSNLISSFTSIRLVTNIEQWTHEEIKCWFEKNHLSNHLLTTFNFIDGSQLLTYAKLIVNSSLRIDEEYDRLRNQIGKDRFYLDEYARF